MNFIVFVSNSREPFFMNEIKQMIEKITKNRKPTKYIAPINIAHKYKRYIKPLYKFSQEKLPEVKDKIATEQSNQVSKDEIEKFKNRVRKLKISENELENFNKNLEKSVNNFKKNEETEKILTENNNNNKEIKKENQDDKNKKICEVCGKSFTNNYLSVHIRKEHPELYNIKCEICGKTFKTEKSKKIHISRKHKENKKETIE